jgi:RimJ/RimL family protein N-acetyltransferase
MKTVVYGQNERVRTWVWAKLEENNDNKDAAIGLEQNGELIAGVVYNMYSGASISMSVAAVPGKSWLNREFLYRSFAYPFIQLKCRRVTGLIKVGNDVSIKFVEALGYKQEGLLRRSHIDGSDMFVYGMLLEECRWIKGHV